MTPHHSRRTEKQRTERQRRKERLHWREWKEMARRHAEPRRDDGPPPRID